MRKLTFICAVALTALIPATALAAPSGADKRNAAKECKALRIAMGAQNFAATYGTNANKRNAFGKCVSRLSREEAAENRAARVNAAKQCRTEQEADAAAFATKYGTGRHGRNAFGKCVSGKAKENKAEADAEDREKLNAARACKAERRADPAKFAQTYGTRRNAFGKCVSTKAQQDQQPS